jgi:3-hydroxy acid dehydrogenase/malonic semialdehyde reductase
MKDKWILITGATSGFGRAIAQRFAAEGNNLIITGRREDRLKAIKADFEGEYKVQVVYKTFDVRNSDEVQEFALFLEEKNLVPDVLVNNAGLAAGKDKIQEGSLDDWEQMIDTNVKGLLYITRAVLPAMIKRNMGHVFSIGSVAGHIVYPEGNVYNATKFAVKALNEAINLDLAGTAIRCCSIDPGAAETEFSLVRFKGDDAKASKVYKGYEALNAEDIADAVWYVANTPPHVNITNMVIYPTAQRSVYVWDKK